MPSVLVVGYEPAAATGLIPGVDPDAIRAGVDEQLARFAERGIDAALATVVADGTAEPALVAALTERPWDVVVVGAGIRKTDALVPLFEQALALIHRHAPQAAVAFNTFPGDTVEAALRRL
ncbi:hypothetical protein ACIBBD_19965 [Streptomyces sp. NPDC051315]|uniref:hypothetical protein n=1 Tax=Streptomyces sp. NPDC051315 TaxID=3365650 RepID=UPI0037B92F94